MDRRTLLVAGAASLAATSARAIDIPFLGVGDAAPRYDENAASTRYGPVRGDLDDGVHVFRGIPYGDTTGGPARFLGPRPPRPWNGVRDATRFGDQSPQTRDANRPAALSSWNQAVDSSEDCLSLNVWTPGLRDNRKRPVMVWIHGGGFSRGNGASPANDGVRLAKRGDVVVVSLNHRLNLFGYLYLAELGGPKYADSGNVGQLDLIAALQWVRDNITEFGGDPGKVTILGQGGGGEKISTLLAMPAARGLFHRAVIQSGAALVARTTAEGTETARKVLSAIGAGHPDDLQRATFGRLLDGLKEVEETPGLGFGPVVDGRNLTRNPFDPDAPATASDIPVMVGYTATETTVVGARPALFDLDWGRLKGELAPGLPGADIDKLIADFRRIRPGASASDAYFVLTTETRLGARSITLAERKAAQTQAAAYLYRLEFETPVDRLRSAHDLDIPLVFDTVGKSPSLFGPSAAEAQKVADAMSSAWIAFARTGSPNAPGLPSWPRYDARSRSTMVFNTLSRAVNDPHSELRQVVAALPRRT